MTSDSLQATYRILDASANRAAEGLRTLEEWTRFGLNQATYTHELKQIRHKLAETVGRLPRILLLSARDTEGDVGTDLKTPTEYQRSSNGDVVRAGVSRTGQSLRVIEEYIKTIDPELAKPVEQLRYRFYIVSAKLELMLERATLRRRIEQARLYVLIDAGNDEASFKHLVASLAKAGTDVIQLRDKHQTDRVIIERAKQGTAIAHDYGCLFLVNDRADLAMASGCDGVHVGQDELLVVDAREIVGHDRLVGLSTHCIEQAEQAVAAESDYIGCGPVFRGNTKSFQRYAGLEYLTQVAEQIQLPAFAIGGIDADNLDQVLSTGITRIAVTGAVRDASDPAAAIESLRARMTVAGV